MIAELENPVKYLTDNGIPLDLISKIIEQSSISVAEFAVAVYSLMNEGLTTEEILSEYREKYPDVFSDNDFEAPRGRYQARTAEEFGTQILSFVWYPYIVRREVNTWMASGGTGKTIALCLIAAYVSKGLALPGDIKPPRPENVLFISSEDTGELLKDRLVKCNADLSRIFILDCVDSIGLNFGERPLEFQSVLAQHHPALVIIDPLTAFIGEVNMDRRNCVRPIMQQLAAIAKNVDCAIVLISHVNKKSQESNLNNSASGSSDIVDASRSACYLAFDEEDERSRLIIHSKYNYTAAGRTVRYTFNENGGIYWNGHSEIDRFTMEEANRRHKTPGEVLRMKSENNELSEMLIRALIDAAKSGGCVKYSYDAFKTRYGAEIFGNQMPKRALDALIEPMKNRGLLLETGKRIRTGENIANGFFISPVPQNEGTEESDLQEKLDCQCE